MAKIDGKYKLIENVNFYELLVKQGVPEDKAKLGSDDKPTLVVSVSGDKVTMKLESTVKEFTSELILGKEVEEVMPVGKKALSTASLSGNVLTVKSKDEGSTNSGVRTYTFQDGGLDLEIKMSDGTTAKRIYKRI